MDAICNPAGFVVYDHAPKTEQPEEAVKLFEKGELREVLNSTEREIPESSDSPARAMELWYIRVQSMLILQYKAEVTKEINANLGILDDSKPEYDHFKKTYLSTEIARLHSWKLRLLLVPVLAGRINQAAIQMYYAMSFEARQEAATGELKDEWLKAVELAGTYVVSALITLRDYSSATELLAVHFRATKNPQLAIWLCLLHIMVGDTLGARTWVAEVVDLQAHDDLQNFIRFAENDSRGVEVAVFSEVRHGNIEAALKELCKRVRDPTATQLEATANHMNIANFCKLIE